MNYNKLLLVALVILIAVFGAYYITIQNQSSEKVEDITLENGISKTRFQ